MNLLITAISAAAGPSEICRHAYNLVRCAANRREIRQITLVVGKWQKSYFRSFFGLEDAKLNIVSVDLSNDALARHLWHLQELPDLADNVAADIVHLSFPPARRRTLRCPVVVSLHDLYPYDESDNLMVAHHRANKNIPLALRVFEELLQREKIGKQRCCFL